MYVTDIGNHDPQGDPGGVVTTFGRPAVPAARTGRGQGPTLPGRLAIDSGGNLYVADTDNNVIRKITPSVVVTTLAGTVGGGSADGTGSSAQFNGPAGVAVDGAGNLYVVDQLNQTVRKVTPAGSDDARGHGGGHRAERRDGRRRAVLQAVRHMCRSKRHRVRRRLGQPHGPQDHPGRRP